LEAPRAELNIPNGVLDIPMAQVRLNQPKIRAALRHVVPAGVPEDVRMNVQGSHARPLCRPIQHKLDRARGKRPAALGDKDVIGRFQSFPKQPPQGPDFHPTHGMIATQGSLRAPDMENPVVEVKLRPTSLQGFAYAQSVGEQNQNQGCVPVAVSAPARRVDQFFYFGLEKVLSLSASPLWYCSLYDDWHHVAHSWNPQLFHRVAE
jgi:hypothetical protein